MAADLEGTLADLARTVRSGQGAVLMDLDGVPIAQAAQGPGAELESVAAEYVGPLRQAQSLAADLDLGAPRGYSVRGTGGLFFFAFAPGDLVLAVGADSTGLRGQMRHALIRALGQLRDL
jgi:predicted regulator of Ras-like GTPase activity (Roadblock/LC7/MglB family)